MISPLRWLDRLALHDIDDDLLNKIEMDECVSANYATLRAFSLIGAACVFLMLLQTFVNPVITRHRLVYLAGTAASLLLFLIARPLYRRSRKAFTALVYVGIAVFLLYGILLGIYTDPGMQSTTFMVMMIFVPLLFTVRPFRVSLFVAVFDLLFLLLAAVVKTGPVRTADLTDGIIFGILGVISNLFMGRIKYQRFLAIRRMYELGNIDQLTGVKNRNSFEAQRSDYVNKAASSLSFVFVDVNGLHELNNAQGHKAGDEMLRAVARCMEDAFGEGNVYRIGGDEFVTLIPDVREEKITILLDRVRRELKNQNYHISVGTSTQPKASLDVEALSLEAEHKMYQDKADFYASRGIPGRIRGF